MPSWCDCVPSCPWSQGPYDTVTMLHGCDGLEGGSTVWALGISANCSSNVAFSLRLPTVLAVPSYLGHAVSVQNSSGGILGCGRFEALFPVDASYRGKRTFRQFVPFLPAAFVDSSNLDNFQYNILEGIAGTCSNKAAIFDPWSPPGLQIGSRQTADQFPVGDLPNHSPLTELLHFLPEVPLIGSDTILGHVVSKFSLDISHQYRNLSACLQY